MGTRLYIRKVGSKEEFCFGGLYHSNTIHHYSSLEYLYTKRCFTVEFIELFNDCVKTYGYDNVGDVIADSQYLEYGEFAVIKKEDFAEFIHKYLEDCKEVDCKRKKVSEDTKLTMPPRFFDWLINNRDASFAGKDEELVIPLRIAEWLINNCDATLFEMRIGA